MLNWVLKRCKLVKAFQAQQCGKRWKCSIANLGPSRHNRFPSKQLGKDTPGAPQVYTYSIIRSTQQQLRWPVPQRHHPTGHRLLMVRVEERCQTKVPNLEHTIVVQEQIGALDVTMQHSLVVAVLQPWQQLMHIALDLRGIDTPPSDSTSSATFY